MSVPGPVLGPCVPWIDRADVVAENPELSGTDPAELDQMALEASAVLFEISGRIFTGLCERTVRPCRTDCRCDWETGWGGWGGWSWRNDRGDHFGCESLSRIKLSGYPVREISEVKIDGAVLPATDIHGKPNYRLDRWQELIRMDDPGPPRERRYWPSCQNMSLNPTEQGTFQIKYGSGIDPPQIGKDAAALLAGQLILTLGGVECQIPQGATKVVRQGITVERGLLANWFDPSKSTGLVPLDLFLRAYWPQRAGRRPAVWSPDVQAFPRPAGI